MIQPSADPSDYKYQVEQINQWSPAAQIEVCLSQSTPERFACDILAALAELSGKIGQLRDKIRSTSWIPSVSRGIAPNRILFLPGEVSTVLPGIFIGKSANLHLPNEVDQEVIDDPSFSYVEDFLGLRGAEAVEAMILVVKQNSMGTAGPNESSELSTCWLGSNANPQILALALKGVDIDWPGWRLVRNIAQFVDQESAEKLYENLNWIGSPEIILMLLDVLANRCKRVGTAGEKEWQLYLEYHRSAVGRPDYLLKLLPHLLLRNRVGNWVGSNALALFDDQFSGEYRLAAELRQQIGDKVELLGSPADACHEVQSLPAVLGEPKDHARNAAQTLKSYFASWNQEQFRNQIGVLLCLLGNGVDGGIKALTEEYLHPRTAQGTQEKLNVRYLENLPGGGAIALQERSWPIAVQIEHKSTAQVRSLAGSDLVAELRKADEAPHLLVEPEKLHASGRPQWIRLRVLPDETSLERRRELLLATFRELAGRLLKRKIRQRFGEFWGELGEPGQVSVGVVRARVLVELPVHLRQLGCREHPGLNQAMKTYDRAFQRSEESKAAKWSGQASAPFFDTSSAMKEFEMAAESLRELVEEDPQAQAFILGKLRGKLKNYQYDLSRIPLELFQNADDAIVQLEDMLTKRSDTLSYAARCFEMQVGVSNEPEHLIIKHWGRCINDFGRGTTYSEQGLEHGYDLDLLHMMLLNVSEKGFTGTDLRMTGRFGLGFKSVHLASSRPRVRSGSLNFEIVAGFIPHPVDISILEEAETADGLMPTIIDLQIDPATGGAHVLLEEIAQYGGLLPVFAQEIRTVRLKSGHETKEASWNGTPIIGVPQIQVGSGSIKIGDEKARWLRISVPGAGGPILAMALQLDGCKVRSLPFGVPTFWCTAPTRDRKDLGVAVNGPFAVDVGRSRLAATDDNIKILTILGNTLGNALCSLALHAAADPSQMASAIGFSAASDYGGMWDEFWRSVWNVFSKPLKSDSSDASEIRPFLHALHGENRGLSALASAHNVIPTGLPNPWKVLTSIQGMRHIAPIELINVDVCNILGSQPEFLKQFPAKSLVSTDTASVLRALNLVDLAPMTLTDMLGVAFPSRVEADSATILETLFRHLDDHLEVEVTRVWMDSLFYKSEAGAWEPAAQLMLCDIPADTLEAFRGAMLNRDVGWEDELLRAAFAPPSRRLHSSYSGNPAALSFFLRSRRRLEVGESAELETWARQASSQKSKVAVLVYLLKGQLAQRLVDRIRINALGWLRDAGVLRQMQTGLEERQLADISARLFPPSFAQLLQLYKPEWQEEFLRPLRLFKSDPLSHERGHQLLTHISNWWSSEQIRDENLRRWHAAHYPSDWPPNELSKALRHSDDPRHDEAWMLVLTLGATQQIGRTRPEQHRGFIDLLRRQGGHRNWWKTLCSPGPPPIDWVGVIEEWAESGIDTREFDWWRGIFPVMYQLRRWLHEYRHVLLVADNLLERNPKFSDLWLQRVNVTLRGTEFDAPPLIALSGLGSHWVIRELARLGVLKGNTVVPHCYGPRAALRRLIEALGLLNGHPLDSSTDVHRLLEAELGPERAQFHGAYDIPLLMVALNSDLRKALLNDRLGAAPTQNQELFIDIDTSIQDPEVM